MGGGEHTKPSIRLIPEGSHCRCRNLGEIEQRRMFLYTGGIKFKDRRGQTTQGQAGKKKRGKSCIFQVCCGAKSGKKGFQVGGGRSSNVSQGEMFFN